MEKFVPEIRKRHKQKQRKTLFLATAISAVGIACLITGIILVVKRNSSRCEAPNVQKSQSGKTVGRCSYLKEAKRAGLVAFLQRVQDKTFEVQPFLIAQKPKVSVHQKFNKSLKYMIRVLRLSEPLLTQLKTCLKIWTGWLSRRRNSNREKGKFSHNSDIIWNMFLEHLLMGIITLVTSFLDQMYSVGNTSALLECR